MSRVKLPILLAFLATVLVGGHAAAWDLEWIHLIGLESTDSGTAVATDSTGVYLFGSVTGALPGQTPLGGRDVYLRKYSFDGSLLWTRQFGTPVFDLAEDMAVHDGGIYVAGRTDGAFPGQTSAGQSDVFVRRYTQDGDVVWTTQLATDSHDTVHGAAANDTGVYLEGETYGTFPGQPPGTGLDSYVARLDLAGGELAWVRQLGMRADVQPPLSTPGGVAVDDTGVYMVTNVVGRMPFRKYDFSGNPVWARDIPDVGDCFIYGFGVSAYGGRVSLIGQVDKGFFENMTVCNEVGVVVGGLRTYTAGGDLVWQRAVEAGPVPDEIPFTGGKVVHVTASGVYVASNTTTTFAGHKPSVPRPDYSACKGLGDTFADSLDGYVRRYDNDGNVVWTHQFGSGVFDLVYRVATGEDAVYASGDTSCSIEGQPYGGGFRDGFLIRFAIDPTSPSGLTQLVVGRLETLEDAGRLTPRDFRGLMVPVEQAQRAIEQAAPMRARLQLQAFIRLVDRYRQRAILTPQEADGLKDAAQAVIAVL
jgi:hypothetical protein